MNNDKVWTVLTTILSCVMVGWALDTDGRYLQQATLVFSGLIIGALFMDDQGER